MLTACSYVFLLFTLTSQTLSYSFFTLPAHLQLFVTIMDQNDNIPVFQNDPYFAEVTEGVDNGFNTGIVGIATDRDKDDFGTVSYNLTKNESECVSTHSMIRSTNLFCSLEVSSAHWEGWTTDCCLTFMCMMWLVCICTSIGHVRTYIYAYIVYYTLFHIGEKFQIDFTVITLPCAIFYPPSCCVLPSLHIFPPFPTTEYRQHLLNWWHHWCPDSQQLCGQGNKPHLWPYCGGTYVCSTVHT